MSPKDSGQNIWFGVAMFLGGVIAGVVLTFASGALPLRNSPTAPSNNPPPQAPQASLQDRMIAYAAEADVDESAFESCMTDNEYTAKINQQTSEGQAAGVTGTPGNIVYDMKSKKGILVSGAQPLANFKRVIDSMLANPTTALSAPGVILAKTVTDVDLENDHIKGDTDATIAVIEYSDYQCPYCMAVHPTYEQLLKDYDGKILWVYRHFPLVSIHPEAMPLAIGAECVSELGGNDAFWTYTDAIMGK